MVLTLNLQTQMKYRSFLHHKLSLKDQPVGQSIQEVSKLFYLGFTLITVRARAQTSGAGPRSLRDAPGRAAFLTVSFCEGPRVSSPPLTVLCSQGAPQEPPTLGVLPPGPRYSHCVAQALWSVWTTHLKRS